MIDVFNCEVTIYDSIKDTKGHRGTFGDFLELALEYEDVIQSVRDASKEALTATGEKKKEAEARKREAKGALPACTVSGVFSKRGNQYLVKHSGLICVDLDAKDNPEWTPESMMKFLRTCAFVAFASRSASGLGVYAIVPIATPERHLEHFRAIESFFKDYGLTVDKQTPDVSRLRFLSYDPDAFFRRNVVAFRGLKAEPREKPKTVKQYTTAYNGVTHGVTHVITDRDFERAEACVAELKRRRLNLCPDRDSWYKMAFSLSCLGERGRRLFHEVAELHVGDNRATSAENDRQFDDALRNNRHITLATFFELCARHGINGADLLRAKLLDDLPTFT